MIKISLNFDLINQAELFQGKKGKYLNLVLWETPNDQYGNDFRVKQDFGKDKPDLAKNSPILGNAKWGGTKTAAQPAPAAAQAETQTTYVPSPAPSRPATQTAANLDEDVPF
jgi:hypothetical protein